MNSVILQLLLLVGAATCHHRHHGWKPGHRYQYEMRGRNVAGLHQVADQFVGLLTKGVVNIQAKTDGRVNVQIEQPEQLDIHQRLARGWRTFIPDEGANYKPLPLVSRSFDLEFKGGIVNKMWVHRDAPTDEANIFKAIASLLQMDTTGENLKKSSYNQIPQANDLTAAFKTTEDTVHGEVETSYSLSPLPIYHLHSQPSLARNAAACPQPGVFSVQKTLNFENARHLPAYHYGFADLPEGTVGGNQMGNMLSRSVNSWAVVCGTSENFLVQSSVTTDKILVAPHLYNDQRGIVVSEFNLTLINVQDSQQEPQGLSADSKEYESLMYDYNDAEASQSSEKKSRSKREINHRHSNSLPKANHPNDLDQPHKMKNDTSFKNENSAEDSSSSSSSSSSDSDSSSEGRSKSSKKTYWQPRPELKSAPNNPLLPYFIAVQGNSIQASPKLNGLEKTENLANSIGRDLVKLSSIAHQQTLSKFTRLVSLLQTMNEEQMSKATEKLYFSYSKASSKSSEDATRYNAWIAYRDATVQAGTGPALLTLRSWIKSCKVMGEEAAELVGTVSRMAHYPSEEFIQSFYDMMVSDDVSKFQQVNTSAIISFAELVRKVLVSNDTAHNRYPVHSFGRPHSRNSTLVEHKFVPHFQEKLAESIRQGDSTRIQVYIWALGTMSHPKVLPIFEQYLYRKTPASHFQRLTMIASLNQMARLYPKLVRPVMFKIYQNTEEKPEIRVAAVMQLMKTNPPAQILQRISEFSNYETSKQVNSAVKSALESAARYIDSNGNQQLRDNARAAVDSLTNYEYGSQYSKIFLSSGAKKNVDLSYVHELTHIQSGDSVFPSSIFCSIKRQLGGFQNPASETFISTSSIANLWALFSSQIAGRAPSKATEAASQTWNYEAIARHLNLEVEPEAQVEGNILTSLLGSKRLFTFDNHTVNQLPEFVRKVVNGGRNPKQFNMTKMFDQLKLKIAFPTALGLPFSYSFNVPTVVAFGGQVHGKVHPDPTRHEGQIPFPKTLNVSADLNMLYSASSESKMGFVTPFNQKEYLAGVKRQVQFHLPLKLDADLDLENTKLWWDVQPLNPKTSSKLFEFSTVPYTAIQNILDILNPSINTEIVNVRRTKKVHTTVGEASMGLAFDLQMDTQQEFLSWSNVYEAVRQHNFMTALLYPLAEEAINYNNFSLIYNGPKSQTTVVKGVVKYNAWDCDSAARQRPMNDSSLKEFDASFDSHDREMQLLKKASEGIKNATSRVLDLSIAFKGPSYETVVVAGAALGSSQVQNRSQVIAFSSFGDNSKATAYKILAELHATSPLLHVINYAKTLQEETKIDLGGKLNFGRRDNMAEIKLDINMMKSEERRQALEAKPMTEVCKKQMSKGHLVQAACRNVTGRSGHMDLYEANIGYKNVPDSLRSTSYVLYTIARYYVTDYMSEQLASGEGSSGRSGHISANLRLSSMSKTANISIASPAINAEFTRVPISPYVTWQAINVHPTYSIISRVASKLTRNQYFPICVVEGSLVNTFDNLTYPSALGDCWYTMAHSFPKPMQGLKHQLPSSNFSIQVRRKGSAGEKEVMMVLDNNVINLRQSQNQPALSWNNQTSLISDERVSRFWDSNHNEVAVAYLVPGNVLVVESPFYNMKLIYDGARVILQLSNTMRESVRGLCGNFNGEKIDDLMVPKNCIHQNPFEFASKYISFGDSCRQHHKKSNVDNPEHCSYANE
uniref:Vitellogenin-1 n=3 Tax=Lygus hesperus TaxID=30085 RepID=A0A0K8T2J6_LYGHE